MTDDRQASPAGPTQSPLRVAEDRRAAITRLLRPRSVAIVGVSPEPGSIGGNVLDNLRRIGFSGEILLVSRTNREIGGRRCFGTIDELPEGVDAAVLAVPQRATHDAITACVGRKVGAAMVFASGFAEMDEAGRAAQDAIARVAQEGSLALCGPNCIGFVNLTDRVALTFEPLTTEIAGRGRAVGVITQSGAMCSTLRLSLLAKKLNLSCVVSTGNEAQLTTEDFLDFLIEDAATRVIVLFMEQIRDPRRFIALAARARDLQKPIVLMHPGRSARARASARSHTGAMVGNHAVMATLVSREAVIMVETLEELIDTADILARFVSAPRAGAAIMTNSGAFKGYALDFAETIGLELPMLSLQSVEAIKTVLPPFAAIENPVDTTAQTVRDPGILGRTAAHLLADPAMGSLIISIVAGAPRFAIDKANAIISGITNLDKPIAVATMGDETELPAEFSAVLRDKGLAFFRSPDRALRAMARATWYGRAVDLPRHVSDVVSAQTLPLPVTGGIAEYQGKRFLAGLGIAVPEGELALTLTDARAIVARIGFPVVLKAQAATLRHKSDAGGVVLDVRDDTAMARGWEAIHESLGKVQQGLVLDGILVEAMGAPGIELVIGARREPGWGGVLTVGLGGIWIEALRDFRLLPADIDRAGIIAELNKLKGAAILRGGRGTPAADLDAVADCLLRIGGLIRSDPRITEVEINPLVLYPKGAIAVDVLMQTEAP